MICCRNISLPISTACALVSATQSATIQSTALLPKKTASNFNNPLDRRVTITALRIRIASVRSLRSNGDRVLLKLAVDLLSKDEEASLLASLGEDDIMGIWIELADGSIVVLDAKRNRWI
jgi:hypothetical protein